MKKQMSAVLALGLALTMTACVPQNASEILSSQQAPAAAEPPAVPEAAVPQTAAEGTVPAISEEIRSQAVTEGTAAVPEAAAPTAAAVKVTQYDGQGYTIDIPDGQWRLESEWDDGRPVQTWESIFYPEAELEVQYYAGLTKEQAQAAVLLDEDDFRLEAQSDGSLMGRDPEDQEILFVRFYPGDNGTYALTYSYLDIRKIADSVGAQLASMADSFQVK